jgi:UDP-2,3-diacylglucosamine pyrophosphatase LpxH
MELLSNGYDKIFIIGDLIDRWSTPVEDTVVEYDDIIFKINSLGNVTIIKGNHDPDIETLQTIFYGVNVTDKYIDDGFVIVHGHEWDDTLKVGDMFFPIHKFFSKFGLNLKAFVRNIAYTLSAFFQNKNKDTDLIFDMEKEIVSNCLEYGNVIITGHTHIPKIVNGDGFIYINTGDWVYNKSYVEYIDGNFILNKGR